VFRRYGLSRIVNPGSETRPSGPTCSRRPETELPDEPVPETSDLISDAKQCVWFEKSMFLGRGTDMDDLARGAGMENVMRIRDVLGR